MWSEIRPQFCKRTVRFSLWSQYNQIATKPSSLDCWCHRRCLARYHVFDRWAILYLLLLWFPVILHRRRHITRFWQTVSIFLCKGYFNVCSLFLCLHYSHVYVQRKHRPNCGLCNSLSSQSNLLFRAHVKTGNRRRAAEVWRGETGGGGERRLKENLVQNNEEKGKPQLNLFIILN